MLNEVSRAISRVPGLCTAREYHIGHAVETFEALRARSSRVRDATRSRSAERRQVDLKPRRAATSTRDALRPAPGADRPLGLTRQLTVTRPVWAREPGVGPRPNADLARTGPGTCAAGLCPRESTDDWPTRRS